ncbi:transposase [Pseudomonas aeruginosa]|nr:transposase [Pseudomonas aeruginosa]
MANDTIAQRPKRHYYSPELKGQIVAECQVSGASVAGVALAHGINANIVHRWMREQADSLLPAPRNEFVALNLPPPVEQLPATETSSPPVSRAIRVDVRRSALPLGYWRKCWWPSTPTTCRCTARKRSSAAPA